MFETNEAYTEMIDQLWLQCEPLDRGDCLTHESIEVVLGVPPNTAHWQYCVNRLRERMQRDRGITMWPERGVGYKLLTQSEQLDMVPRVRALRAERQYRRSHRSIAAIPDASLPSHQKRLKAARLEALRSATQAAQAHRRTLKTLTRKPEGTPRPRVGVAT